MATAPNLDADNEDKDPPNEPIGVRAAPTMTISLLRYRTLDTLYLRNVMNWQ